VKIMIESHAGDFKQVGWYIKESDTGFYCYLDKDTDVSFKFPWKLYTYKQLEEK